MEKELEQLREQVLAELKKAKDAGTVEQLENKYLGRKGKLTQVMKGVKQLSPEQKPKVGKKVNEVKQILEAAVVKAKEQYGEPTKAKSNIDYTLPGKKVEVGGLHPISIVQRQMEEIFSSMGFIIADGPELESDFYNFEALNIPKTHPSRDLQDTFYIDDHTVLRTHTTPNDVRLMRQYGAPLRAITPGRVYRYEATDASHDSHFYQIDGVMVGENITVGNLIAMVDTFLKAIFGQEFKTRVRPGYFPFTEPSLEVDLSCWVCAGKGCRTCGQTGWVEFMGSGLLHPHVLRAGKVDPEKYNAWAFGFGLSRLTMMKYGIDDVRLLMSSDLRFLKQFN
ncbi:MAG: phenylalanine--tRNA ligase subunit alpha [Candidatus Buchananbacteria bacterium CG10_big_fil_rev_8_21_14_0_10_42_9]|uniref:Phenylalanine--tRNA ligase alpha subunit n=1 Tax=Candidatus Buchananbacteria bacterium CG10_big_fil_rev_8_21_14_0_10_42_9 TaxID=1974526 RepID=A0A2H0W2R0_9BACT|nr:MAG: phenylalanine--tRNA ligase subunit alpha [Candidatus Buchananbacteria bacterium CG10_big_fil_rev_8_21_14_0_10_42_9]